MTHLSPGSRNPFSLRSHLPRLDSRLAILAIGLFLTIPTLAAPPSGAGWHLSWNDEFNTPSLDTSKWRHWLLGARRDAVNAPAAVSVQDGSLAISTFTSGGTHYTGMISTQNTFSYTYGYIEARISYSSSPGMWSAFWMQSPTMGNPIGSPNSAGTEIDICEHRSIDSSGNNISGLVVGNLHWDGYGASHKSIGYTSPNLGLGTGFHIYGMEWTPTQHKFYINGVLRWTVNNSSSSPVSQRSEFVILSSEVSNGSWAGAIPSGGYGSLATTTTRMLVDYVRIYRRAETVVNGDFEGRTAPFSTTNQASWSSTGGNSNPASARIAPVSGTSTVEQTVRGLVPDTSYLLTAFGRAGTTAPNLVIGARNHGNPQTSQTLVTDTYTRASIPFTTSPSNTTASVFASSSSLGSTAFVDDFLLRRALAVNNGQLEAGDSLAWNSIYGGATVSSDGVNYGGDFAWRIPASTSSAGVEQEVFGLTPSTAYRLTAWTTNANNALSFGVKNHGAAQVLSTVTANTWTRGTVNFTTGPSSTTATIFAFRNSSTQPAYADSFFLSQPLPSPWLAADVGSPGLSGTSGRLGSKWVAQACGANLGGTSDKMHFIYQPITGDASLTARVLSLDTPAFFSKTGVMIRESTADNARSASITWGPVNQSADFSFRSSTGASASSSTTGRELSSAPWLRITRRGNAFTAYHSADGISWTRVGSPQTIAMTSSALIGIPTCSGDSSRFTEAVLDNLSITPPIPDVVITSPVDASTTTTTQSIQLTASVTDPSSPSILWSKVSGPGAVTFSSSSLATTSAAFSSAGTYVIRCTATNAAGSGADDHTIHVTPPTSTDPSLVLRLRLDESSGTTASDASGSNNHGTANGGITWRPTSGILGGAASFNGSSSHLLVQDSPSLDNTSAFSLSFWFNATSLNGAGLVAKRISFNDNNSYSLFLTPDGKLNIDIDSNNNRFTSTTTFDRGQWYHVSLVFDGTLASSQRAKLYVNGALDTTATETSASVPNYNSPLTIGAISTPSTTFFDGLIDEVRFNRRALSSSEVVALANEKGNRLPIVSTGPAPATLVNTPAVLAGSAIAESGTLTSILWSKISGPGNVIFANPSSPTTQVTFDQPGEYTLRLTATNAVGQSFAEFTDTIFSAALPAPVTTITRPTSPVYLADSLHRLTLAAAVATSGVPGQPAITWTQVSGPATALIEEPSALETVATFPSPGTYVLRCSATNAGGSSTADLTVLVASPSSSSFRQGINQYNHTATFIRADSPNWNSGARDQMLVGKSFGGPAFRSILSFPLSGIPSNANVVSASLDLTTHDSQAGIGTISTLELRSLTSTPVEGTGNSSTDASNGSGTGATWISRTGSLPWTTQGGDFETTVLSSSSGFNTTNLNSPRSFTSSSAFTTAVRNALAASLPLNLVVLSPATEAGANNIYTRLASDDHPTAESRPLLTVRWFTNPAPIVNPGTAPTATTGIACLLTGSASGENSCIWTLNSGPGTATFANPALASTSVTFSEPGIYQLSLTATNTNASVSRSLEISVAPNPARFTDWQTLAFPGITDDSAAAPDSDPDMDGINNLLEWALHLDPLVPDRFTPTMAINGQLLQFTYTRRKTSPGAAEFQVLWSDTLEDDWSDEGVSTESIIAESESTATVRVSLPASSDKRFVRIRATIP